MRYQHLFIALSNLIVYNVFHFGDSVFLTSSVFLFFVAGLPFWTLEGVIWNVGVSLGTLRFPFAPSRPSWLPFGSWKSSVGPSGLQFGPSGLPFGLSGLQLGLSGIPLRPCRASTY